MTQNPTSVSPAGGSEPRRGNGVAIASLIFGLFGCVPVVTGLLAILFGVLGLRRSRLPGAGGKGLSAAGLTLGIVSLLAWSGILTFGLTLWGGSEQPRAVGRQVLTDFSRGDLKAVQLASAPNVTANEIESVSDLLSPLGNLTDVQFMGVYAGYFQGAAQWRLNGVAHYARGNCPFMMTVIRIGDAWKVTALHVQPDVKSPPPQQQTIQT